MKQTVTAAEGEEQGAEIMASADRERVVIVAVANEEAAQIRGEGDAPGDRHLRQCPQSGP